MKFSIPGYSTYSIRTSNEGSIACGNVRSALVGEPVKIGQNRGDQIAVLRIPGVQGCRVKVQDIAGFGGGFRPGRGRSGHKLDLKGRLSVAQRIGICFNLGQRPSDIGCLLRRHAPATVELDWIIAHVASASMRCASESSRQSMLCISMDEPRRFAEGTMIMVPIRR